MTALPKLPSDYSACTSPVANNILLGMGNGVANVMKFSIKNILGNSSCNVAVGANSLLIVSNAASLNIASNGNLIINRTANPANSTVGGYVNSSFFFSNTYIYAVLANGYIMRAALSSF